MANTLAKLNAATRNAEHRIRCISAARTLGDDRSAKFLTTKYLQSYDARLAAVGMARRKLPWSQRPMPKSLPDIAKTLNAFSGTNEPALVELIPKGDNGDYRKVVNFGIENRALQYLIAPLLRATCEIHPHQYGSKGVPAAIDQVGELIKSGYLWTKETDIRNCFPSFEGENLHTMLHLPKRVISHVIMGENLNVVPGDTLLNVFGPAEGDDGDPFTVECFLAEARQGIPHGSAHATLIAEMLIAPVLKSLPNGSQVPSYVDNMLTMALSKDECESVTQTLWSALIGHPVGHLKPRLVRSSNPGQPVVFLGHRLNLQGTNLLIEPTPENDAEFKLRAHRKFKHLCRPAATAVRKMRAEDLEEYVNSWTGSFARCLGMKERRDYWLTKIQSALK